MEYPSTVTLIGGYQACLTRDEANRYAEYLHTTEAFKFYIDASTTVAVCKAQVGSSGASRADRDTYKEALVRQVEAEFSLFLVAKAWDEKRAEGHP